MTALDAKTGAVVWTFYTVPAPGDPFFDGSWPDPNNPDPQIADAWKYGGATIWQAPAIDPDLGMMYFGDVVWDYQTGLPISAPPMAWSDGTNEYITLAVGGNRGGATTLDGDQVWTFSLNGNVDQVEAPPPPVTKLDFTGNPIKLGQPQGTTNTLAGDTIFDGTVQVLDYVFQPRQVQVPVGTTVQFGNSGTVTHTATAQDNSWDSGDIAPGETVWVTFSTAGTWIYNCTPHPWMVGKIVVQ
jgi:plastocyanin